MSKQSLWGLVLLGTWLSGQLAQAAEPQWIWGPMPAVRPASTGDTCYFRKLFVAPEGLDSASVRIACDNQYRLYVNGEPVGQGDDWKVMKSFNVKKLLLPGSNIVAIEALHEDDRTPAGLVASIQLKAKDFAATFESNGTWKTSREKVADWTSQSLDDTQWVDARPLGEFGKAAPWLDKVQPATESPKQRFKVPAGYHVEQVISSAEAGSLAAMAFNELGDIVAARETGPLITIRDSDGDGKFDKVTEYADRITHCQGLLPLNGQVYAVGQGPQGASFCRLTDEDNDGQAEKLETLFKFKGGIAEHGPHAVVLGPDGLIYIAVGNHSEIDMTPAATSPLRRYYEGDLVQPKYEDPSGHAADKKAPGGLVVRTDLDGSFHEVFAGGLRNHYDIAFNADGELFTFDSDMEWDEGLPWYRPCRVNHVVPGGEYGWRSGWSKWPEYYLDSLPATLNVGRGSPTGVEFYNHLRYPAKYHGAMFAGDWSQGRILAVTMKPENGTYTATSEIFVQGQPLNVTDLAVGPDGWLYFCTGGRDSEGGVFRITCDYEPPAPNLQKGVMQALHMPQPYSAWGRDRIARISQKMGADWSKELALAADDKRLPDELRVRAISFMQLIGPFPSKRFLIQLSNDRSPAVRAKATYLMGIHIDLETNARLTALLSDPDPNVRRAACVASVRAQHKPPVEALLKLLVDPHPYVRWAAGRALQEIPRGQWQPLVLASKDPTLFNVGTAFLMGMDPDQVTMDTALDRCYELTQGPMDDIQFRDLLRVTQLTMIRGQMKREHVMKLSLQLADEYPTTNWRLNRELVRLLVYLREPTALDRMFEELVRNTPHENPAEDLSTEKLHLGLHLRFFSDQMTDKQRLKLLEFYERAHTAPGGNSLNRYVDLAARDFLNSFNDELNLSVLERGTEMPGMVLQLLKRLPEPPQGELLTRLIRLDDELQSVDSKDAHDLRTGILAVLGLCGDADSVAHLHKVFESEPERRQDVAFAIAAMTQSGPRRVEDWRVLVRSLSVVEGPAAQMVMQSLLRFRQLGTKPDLQRQVILLGLKLKDEGGEDAIKLLEHWTRQKAGNPEDDLPAKLAAWQDWFAKKNPELPPAVLPVDPLGSKYTYDELLQFVTSAEARHGDAARGAVLFETKGQCIKCHKMGTRGEGVGPDLTAVSQRFQRKEILQSMMYPSLVISDQYASQTVTTQDGLIFTGILGPLDSETVVILQADGKKVEVKKKNIESTAPSPKSAMPEGLLNTFSKDEIADLFEYLTTPLK